MNKFRQFIERGAQLRGVVEEYLDHDPAKEARALVDQGADDPAVAFGKNLAQFVGQAISMFGHGTGNAEPETPADTDNDRVLDITEDQHLD